MTLRNKLLFAAALGLSLCLGTVASSRATDKFFPPRYAPAPCPTPTYQIIPSQPAMPSAPSATPATPTDPSQPAQPAQPAQPDAAATAPIMDAGAALAAAESGSSAGAGGGHLGRADQSNRLNLFDTQAAFPQNRVWFSVQRVDEYKTGLVPAPSPSSIGYSSIQSALKDAGLSPTIIERQAETLYRVGAEVKLGCNMSISVQGQYLTFDGDDSGGSDTFTNPQILLKYALINCPGRAVSATLGYQPDIDTGLLEFNDNCHAVYPGMLFYQDVNCRTFVQGGFQFRIPLEDNNIYTFDYAISFGYWLWRHPSLDNNCGFGDCYGCGKKPLILGLIPQVEFFGKHVIGDATIENPFGLQPLDFGSPGAPLFFNPFVYEEPRHVYDVTVGARLMLAHNSSIAAAVSYPLTGSSVRQQEYFITFNIGF